MLRLSAHLSMLYTELPFLRRLDAAARDGFEAVEFWAAPDPAATARRARRLGLSVALINVPAGDGPRACGRMGDPRAVRWWRERFADTLDAALELGCATINLLAGDRSGTALLENLAWAVERRGDAPVALALEPLNLHDRPGYLLPHAADVLALLEQAGTPPRCGVLLDAYHVARAGEDPLAELTRCGAAVRHVQVADAPGRHEPGTGAIDFAAFLRALAAGDYDGWVGLEYEPTGDVAAAARRVRALAAQGEEAPAWST